MVQAKHMYPSRAAQDQYERKLQGNGLVLKSQPKLLNGKILSQNILNSSITIMNSFQT
ncbi:hypothetical protein I79_022815 [Cricetulus griseus]|uniref:Uncharacterized protein n=1 Tax=Cricetulus griseus TaxID=10029 RepID=G3IGD2_CRIGR|nr:hypothetical protein I79_022815 [Cricetulus griseus]